MRPLSSSAFSEGHCDLPGEGVAPDIAGGQEGGNHYSFPVSSAGVASGFLAASGVEGLASGADLASASAF